MIFMAIYLIMHYLVELPIIGQAINPVGIAIIHSIFNISTTLLLLPFSKQLVKIAEGTIKTEPEKEIAFLDERLLNTPSIAVQECSNLTKTMGHQAKASVMDAMELIFNYDEKKALQVKELEGEVDVYEDRLGAYMVKLSGTDLSDEGNKQVSEMLHAIGDFERISDHAVNIMEAAKEIHEKKIVLSDEGLRELKNATEAIREIMTIAIQAFEDNDLDLAYHVEPLEEVMDGLIDEIKRNHIARLQTGECTIQHGFVLSDILTNYEKVSDHCSNLAVAIIEKSRSSFDPHKYLDKLKTI